MAMRERRRSNTPQSPITSRDESLHVSDCDSSTVATPDSLKRKRSRSRSWGENAASTSITTESISTKIVKIVWRLRFRAKLEASPGGTKPPALAVVIGAVSPLVRSSGATAQDQGRGGGALHCTVESDSDDCASDKDYLDRPQLASCNIASSVTTTSLPIREPSGQPLAPLPAGRRRATDKLKHLQCAAGAAWSGRMEDPHCSLCSEAHPGGWSAAGPHLACMHPAVWAHIESTGGLESSSCMGCACGYTSHAIDPRRPKAVPPAWNRTAVARHRKLHAPGSAPPAAMLPCGLDGCTLSFRGPTELTGHQEGPAHRAIPYVCPFSCERARGGSGGPLVGRRALRLHLTGCHKGDAEGAPELDLSWAGLVAFRA